MVDMYLDPVIFVYHCVFGRISWTEQKNSLTLLLYCRSDSEDQPPHQPSGEAYFCYFEPMKWSSCYSSSSSAFDRTGTQFKVRVSY